MKKTILILCLILSIFSILPVINATEMIVQGHAIPSEMEVGKSFFLPVFFQNLGEPGRGTWAIITDRPAGIASSFFLSTGESITRDRFATTMPNRPLNVKIKIKGDSGDRDEINFVINPIGGLEDRDEEISVYRFKDNKCSFFKIFESNRRDLDFNTLSECKSNIVSEICINGKVQKFTCPEGIEVDYCICENNNWNCIDNPENQCIGSPTDIDEKVGLIKRIMNWILDWITFWK